MKSGFKNKNLILAIVAIIQTILIVTMVTFAWIEGVDESRLHGNNVGISSSPKLLISLSDVVGTIEINDFIDQDFALKEVSSIDGKNLFVAEGYENVGGKTFRTLRQATDLMDKNISYLQFDVSMVFDASGQFEDKLMNVFINPYKSYVIKSQDATVDRNLLGIEAGAMQAFAESQGFADVEAYFTDFVSKTRQRLGLGEDAQLTADQLDDYYDYLYVNQDNPNIPDCPPYKPRYATTWDETGYLVSQQAPSAVLNPIRVSLTYNDTTVIMGMREEDNGAMTWEQLVADASATKAVSALIREWSELSLTQDQIMQQDVKAHIAGQRVYSLCGTMANSFGCNAQNKLFTLNPNQEIIVTIRIWLEGGDVETTDEIANTEFDIQLYFDTSIVDQTN
ncbi:MAG: hypothetical protein IJF72_01860 [Clostridia bacterium]|nr:hypothetical protein [Clostridia bacterium]